MRMQNILLLHLLISMSELFLLVDYLVLAVEMYTVSLLFVECDMLFSRGVSRFLSVPDSEVLFLGLISGGSDAFLCGDSPSFFKYDYKSTL